MSSPQVGRREPVAPIGVAPAQVVGLDGPTDGDRRQQAGERAERRDADRCGVRLRPPPRRCACDDQDRETERDAARAVVGWPTESRGGADHEQRAVADQRRQRPSPR